jgi:hypothetical protein
MESSGEVSVSGPPADSLFCYDLSVVRNTLAHSTFLRKIVHRQADEFAKMNGYDIR